MGGGAWPFLVGGVICLVNSVNERDLNLLNSYANVTVKRGVAAWRFGFGWAFVFLQRRVVAFVAILLRGTIHV